MAEINNFKEGIKRSNQVINDITITKQAFSQVRRKVSPKAFIHLLNEVNKWFYNDTPFNKYRGYRLLAIDGTVLQLHDSENLRNVIPVRYYYSF